MHTLILPPTGSSSLNGVRLSQLLIVGSAPLSLQLGHCLLARVFEGSILASRSGLRDHHSLREATHHPALSPFLIFYKIPTAGNPAFTTLLSYNLSLQRGEGAGKREREAEKEEGEKDLWDICTLRARIW